MQRKSLNIIFLPLFSLLILLSCKSTYINNDLLHTFIEVEKNIPVNDTIILKSYNKINFEGRPLDGEDVAEIIKQKNHFGISDSKKNHEIKEKKLMEIIKAKNVTIFWKEIYNRLYYYKDEKKILFSSEDEKKIINSKPFVLIEQEINSKNKAIISVTITDWVKKRRKISKYYFTKEKYWNLVSIKNKEVKIFDNGFL